LQIVEGPIAGPIIIRTDTRLYGVVSGDVTVPRGVRLELEGVVTGNLLACPGSKVMVHGEVRGRLFNEGGSVSIYGEVGSVRDSEEHRSYLAPCAVVRDAEERRKAG
jgi:cytoskeletal protein CcmA (bactofilin family)